MFHVIDAKRNYNIGTRIPRLSIAIFVEDNSAINVGLYRELKRKGEL